MIDKSVLNKVEAFEGLTNTQLELVSGFLKEKSVKKGEYIIKENTTGNTLYILYKGIVKVTRKLTMEVEGLKAEEKTLATLSDKHIPAFGVNGLVDAGKRTANVIAKSDCTIYCFTRYDFEKLVDMDTEIGYLIMRNTCRALAKWLEETDEYVVKLATALSIAVSMRE